MNQAKLKFILEKYISNEHQLELAVSEIMETIVNDDDYQQSFTFLPENIYDGNYTEWMLEDDKYCENCGRLSGECICIDYED